MDVLFQYELIGGPRDGGAVNCEHLLSVGCSFWIARGDKLMDLYKAWWHCRTQRVVLVFERTEIRPENEVHGC